MSVLLLNKKEIVYMAPILRKRITYKTPDVNENGHLIKKKGKGNKIELNYDCWMTVFSYLTYNTLVKSCSRVSKQFNEMANRSIISNRLEYVVSDDEYRSMYPPASTRLYKLLNSNNFGKNIKMLYMQGAIASFMNIPVDTILKKCLQLNDLSISWFRINKLESDMPIHFNLKNLEIKSAEICGGETLKNLFLTCPNIKKLKLDDGEYCFNDVRVLRNLEKLNFLNMKQGRNFGKFTKEILENNPNLYNLKMNVSSVSDGFHNALQSAKNLTSLTIFDYENKLNIHRNDSFKHLINLKKLGIAGLPYYMYLEEYLESISDTIEVLKIMQNLRNYELTKIINMKKLKVFAINVDYMVPDYLSRLSENTNINEFRFYGQDMWTNTFLNYKGYFCRAYNLEKIIVTLRDYNERIVQVFSYIINGQELRTKNLIVDIRFEFKYNEDRHLIEWIDDFHSNTKVLFKLNYKPRY